MENEEKLDRIEDTKFDIKCAIESLAGIEELKDEIIQLKDILSSLEEVGEQIEEKVNEQNEAELDEMNREYMSSVL